MKRTYKIVYVDHAGREKTYSYASEDTRLHHHLLRRAAMSYGYRSARLAEDALDDRFVHVRGLAAGDLGELGLVDDTG